MIILFTERDGAHICTIVHGRFLQQTGVREKQKE